MIIPSSRALTILRSSSGNCDTASGRRLVAVRVFFRWMTRQHHLLFNPAGG
jgi:site-specific recombinase XerD